MERDSLSKEIQSLGLADRLRQKGISTWVDYEYEFETSKKLSRKEIFQLQKILKSKLYQTEVRQTGVLDRKTTEALDMYMFDGLWKTMSFKEIDAWLKDAAKSIIHVQGGYFRNFTVNWQTSDSWIGITTEKIGRAILGVYYETRFVKGQSPYPNIEILLSQLDNVFKQLKYWKYSDKKVEITLISPFRFKYPFDFSYVRVFSPWYAEKMKYENDKASAAENERIEKHKRIISLIDIKATEIQNKVVDWDKGFVVVEFINNDFDIKYHSFSSNSTLYTKEDAEYQLIKVALWKTYNSPTTRYQVIDIKRFEEDQGEIEVLYDRALQLEETGASDILSELLKPDALDIALLALTGVVAVAAKVGKTIKRFFKLRRLSKAAQKTQKLAAATRKIIKGIEKYQKLDKIISIFTWVFKELKNLVLNDKMFANMMTDHVASIAASSIVADMKKANLTHRAIKEAIAQLVEKKIPRPEKHREYESMLKLTLAVLRDKDKAGRLFLKNYVFASFKFRVSVNLIYHILVTNTNNSISDFFKKVAIDTCGELLEEILESDNVLVKSIAQGVRKTIGNLFKP